MTKQTKLAGLFLTAAALVLYLSNTARYAFPNEWSAALGSIVGMDPFRPLSRPVWQFFMYAFSLFPGAGVLAAANLFNALLGGLAVWLAYLIGWRLMAQPAFARSENERAQLARARLVSGLVTAGFLGACMPVMVLATRAHPLMLDLVLLMAALYLSLLYRDRRNVRLWYLFAALYGVGISEFATFIILFPMFAVLWSWMFWKNRANISLLSILAGIGLIAAGAMISVVFCWMYSRSEIAEWRAFESFFQVCKFFLLDQVNQLRFSVPRQGWLVVLLTMVLPAVFVLRSDYYADHDVFTKVGLYSMRLILVAVAFVVLFNLPGSPWHVIGPNVLLVTPYLITACWAGQLAGFFYHAAARPAYGRPGRARKANPLLRHAVTGVSAAGILAGAALNMVEASPSRAAPLVALSRDVLDAVDGHSYMISNGAFDTVMLWEAYRKGQAVRIINPAQVNSAAYRRFMNTWFNDPALESMSLIGFAPLLDLWMSGNPSITRDLAIQAGPEVWKLQGFDWIPASGVYLGQETEADSSGPVLYRGVDNKAFLERHLEAFGGDARWPALVERYRRSVAAYLSVFANNAGYRLLMEDRPEEAEALLDLAVRYDDGNLSALINLGEIARLRGDENKLQELQDRYNRHVILMPAAPNGHQLMRQYGLIRNQALFMEEGLALMRAGLNEQGLQLVEASIETGGTGLSSDLRLAQALFSDGRFDRSLAVYEQLLTEDAGSVDAWLGIARCSQMLGRYEEAESVFEKLADMGVPADRLAMEKGYLRLREGKQAEALEFFRSGLKNEQSGGAAAVGMIWAAFATGSTGLVTEAEAVLQRMPDYYAGQMMLFELAMSRENYDAARAHISNVLRVQPGNTMALEKAIRLDLLEDREQQARVRLDRLLSLDSAHMYGNYLLAGMHEADGRLDLAENALRRALRAGRNAEVYYGLAWVLNKQERYEEALDAAVNAVQLNPANPQYHAVKGIVLCSLGQWREAEEALRGAIRLRTDRDIPLFSLYLARALREQGRIEESDQLLSKYTVDDESLKQDERDLLIEMSGLNP